MRRAFAALAAGLALGGCAATGASSSALPTSAPSSPAVAPPSNSPSSVPGKPTAGDGVMCTGRAEFDRPMASSTNFPGTVTTTGSKAVALTFDDGPDPGTTPKVLDLLRNCGVKATFCVNGIKAQSNPTLIRRIVHEGHTMCNHTWRHITQLGSYGKELIEQDLADTNNAIKAIVPEANIGYFRAPGGRWTEDYIIVARKLGMTPLHWDVDTSDWDHSRYGKGQSMINHIVHEVQNQTKPGSVVLAHDFNKPDTVAAFTTLLPWLKARVELISLPPGGIPAP
ncbi:polysaccharide deacetylase family protein [Catelliglobosispora koreensis]|uniref:polysaccharide deacetylase family protein n=1 Tax=Catelliglobosispora koreensis TaxID=129052 RepID=UPI00035FB6A7|nr:polysaccharide deacetylase family protein [Catelliglobosispora koreensis]